MTPPSRLPVLLAWEVYLARAVAIRVAHAWRKRWQARHVLPVAHRIRGEMRAANDNRGEVWR